MDAAEIIREFLLVFPRRCRKCNEAAEREGHYASTFLNPVYLCDKCEHPPLVYVEDSVYASLLRAAKKFIAKT